MKTQYFINILDDRGEVWRGQHDISGTAAV